MDNYDFVLLFFEWVLVQIIVESFKQDLLNLMDKRVKPLLYKYIKIIIKKIVSTMRKVVASIKKKLKK